SRLQEGALYWAASQLNLPTLADAGHEGAGQGIHTPVKQPADGRRLAIDNRSYNRLLRCLRGLGERGFALLTRRWYALRRTNASLGAPVLGCQQEQGAGLAPTLVGEPAAMVRLTINRQ